MSNTLKKECITIAVGVTVMSIVMLAVFAVLGYFDYTAVLGALLGWLTAVGNFVLLGITVQRAAKKTKPTDAKAVLNTSYMLRMLVTAAVIVLGIKVDIFNYVAVLLPLLFPRIVIFITNIFRKEE